MNIRDAQLRTFVSQVTTSTAKTIDDTSVIRLLAAVGDTTTVSEKELRGSLANKTRQEQFDTAKAGLDATEKADLVELLAKAAAEGVTFSPKAKNFLEALVGTAALDLGLPPVDPGTGGGTGSTGGLVADSSGVRGTVSPNATVLALNMSTAVTGRQHITETTELGRADATGAFTSGPTLAVSPGDRLRVNVRAASGTDGWSIVTVGGTDTTPAKVNIERIDLIDDGSGGIQISHNTARPIAEPGAVVRLTNTRTGAAVDLKINDEGSFAATSIVGGPGDSFALAVTDGISNRDFRTVAATLRVGGQGGSGFDLEDPLPLKEDRRPTGVSKFEKVRYRGPLFVDGVKFDDPRQGAIGNCYEPSGTGSVALTVPAALENVVVKEVVDPTTGAVDKTYTFTFYEVDFSGNATPHEVTVDGDLWVRSFGGPVYGATLSTPRTPEQMELWYALREKARAKWKGGADGYEATGQGGIAGEVAGEILGRPYEYETINTRSASRVFELIKKGMAQKAQGKINYAMSAGTYGHDQEARYAGEGVYANHAYTILDATEENGVKYVHLRNPWGQSEPAGNGDNDGIFKLPLDKFVNLYQSFNYVDPNRSGPAFTPRDPHALNSTLEVSTVPGPVSKDPDLIGFMTTAQKALFEVLRNGSIGSLSPTSVAEWLVDNYPPLKEMSLEAALQCSKDLARLRARIEELKGTSAAFALDSLTTELKAVILRERAAIRAARKD